VVKRNEIFKYTQKVVKRECGADYAERYEAWYRFRNDTHHQPLIVLIGGASGVGKTSAGVALANHLKISRVVSTDAIRQIMRLMISPELMPALHASSYEAWKHIGAISPNQSSPVVQAFREQALRVCVGVRAMIERAIEENTSMIVDGVHVLPDLIDLKKFENKAIFVWINFYLEDEKQYAERFKIRGQAAQQRSSHRYIENLNGILEIQRHILNVGETHHVPIVENTNFEETVQSVSQQIMDVLRKIYKN
jgi:2-phosphoglycerate kinase